MPQPNVGGPARFLILLSLAAATLALVAAPAVAARELRGGGPADPGLAGYPNAMASTGDSITRAFNTGSFPFTDAPQNSWSTGTTPSIATHYVRILAANPAIAGHNNNDAVTGAKMTDLNGQVQAVNSQQVDYVTILLGANDACTPSEAAMTPVTTFRAQFQQALDTLTGGSPSARIFVASVPSIYYLWAILHNDSSAVATWNALGICQSMLLNPQSTAQADVDRRARVNQRVIDFNTQLAQVCAQYIHCRFDNNAVFNTAFVPSDVSTRDYFHPAIAGQTRLAATSYAATFDFTDATPPISTARVQNLSMQTLDVLLTATDNVGVAGIEYKINTGAYTPYKSAVWVGPGDTITYRAVDVNGNVEASHSLTAP
ncbi:MAG TPA: SGNH/GDSL hydrolase family protein [Chloroflexia bacterium]|nr:SGNH/GDSL hydrolase family protein [Chloroflexia bacterium]